MRGGFATSRYNSDKFAEITAAARKDGEQKPRSSGELAELVQDPVQPLLGQVHGVSKITEDAAARTE